MIMVRGRRIFMLRACVILVLAMAVLSRAYTPKETYIKSIREEWGIILPATEWEVYNEAIGSSFAGKGVRYHVFRYQNTSAIQEGRSLAPGKKYAGGAEDRRTLRDMDIAKGYEVNFNGGVPVFYPGETGQHEGAFPSLFPGPEPAVCGGGLRLNCM